MDRGWLGRSGITLRHHLGPNQAMALVTISGYPCSGKTTRALKLKEAFEQRLSDPAYAGPVTKVVLISDDTLELSREAYSGIILLLFHYLSRS